MVGQLDDAQIRLKGRERVVGDFGTGSGNHRKESRFPGIRLADETDVRDQLELHLDGSDDSFFARLPLARRLMGSGREESISLPASSALRDHGLLPVFQDLDDDLAGPGISQNRTRRYRHHHVLAGAAGLVATHPVLAPLRDPAIAIGVVEQRREVLVAADDDVATAPAVAAIGAAHWGAPLSTKRCRAGAAGASFYSDYGAVDEHPGTRSGFRTED